MITGRSDKTRIPSSENLKHRKPKTKARKSKIENISNCNLSLIQPIPNAGTGENIVKPNQTKELDYEVELVLVIGKEGKNIPRSQALQYIGGYTVGNDVSARDWQLRKPGTQWMVGKTWDTFAPIGPSILLNPLLYAPSDTSFNPDNLNVRCILNGNTVQNSNTKDFIFNVSIMIEYISQIVTLKPGDLIFTGTPQGVGMGRKPQLWMQPGDKVRCEIDELGAIENTIVSPSAL
jgi:2-keto-4-pentenoate hydratase/2-oxohepta-3-ene-1,7-dioic acid hydratase in catechol pathway